MDIGVQRLIVSGLIVFLLSVASATAQTDALAPFGRGNVRTLDSPELARVLGYLQDQRIIPLDGTFQSLLGSDTIVIPLEDRNQPDRRVYMYFWPSTGGTYFLQPEGTLENGGQAHLWNAQTELLITPHSVRRISSPDGHHFSTRSLVQPLSLSVDDALSCIADTLGISPTDVNLTNALGLLNGACVSANFTNLALTAISCLTAEVPACLAGVAQMIACGAAKCTTPAPVPTPTGCTGPPKTPLTLVASVSGNTVTLTWTGSDNATSYQIEAGSSAGASDIVVSDTKSTATTLTAPNVGNGRYYVRVRGKNDCGVSGATNEVSFTVGNITPPPPPTATGTFQVSPSSANIGRIGGCSNQKSSAMFSVAVPADVTWKVVLYRNSINESATPQTGRGPGTFTYTLGDYIPVPAGYKCVDDTAYPFNVVLPTFFDVQFTTSTGQIAHTLIEPTIYYLDTGQTLSR